MNKRYLFIVPARLGDALMLTPALRLLKHSQPECLIDVLAYSELGAEAYQNNPHCENVFSWRSIPKEGGYGEEYDLIVAAHPISDVELLREKFLRPILVIEKPNLAIHQSAQALQFIARVFCDEPPQSEYPYEFHPNEGDNDWAKTILDPTCEYIGIHLGCHGINKISSKMFSWPRKTRHKKLWPVDRYVGFARRLREKYPEHRIVLTGGLNEIPLSQPFIAQIPEVVNLMGQTTVSQLAALMKRLSVYVCPDSGTMHLACAMEVPIVAFFGPTDVNRTGPYLARRRRILQQTNLEALEIEDVLDATSHLLDQALAKESAPHL